MSRSPLLALCVLLAVVLPAAIRSGEQPASLALQIGALQVAPLSDPAAQLVRVRVEGAAPRGPWTATVTVAGRSPVSSECGELTKDKPFFTVSVPGVESECDVRVELSSGAARASSSIRLRPLKPWTIFIVQHTHTDMGYTDYPTRLSADHIDFIEEAVRACDHTDSYPDDAKFRWTCEGTWAVKNLSRERPRRLFDRFLDRVSQGRIEVAAMNMNMTDLATEEVVVRSFYPVAELRGRGVPVHSAMQCDVNGYPWALPEFLADIGVTGFVGGINRTRSTLPFDFPRGITWKSPGGGAVLAWRGEHYMMANFLGFQDSIDKVLTKLPGYLRSLEDKGYPYKAVLLQMAGYFTDNAAPSYKVCDLVKEWNERYSNPRVRVATVSEFISALGASPDAPVMQKAWCDWWADGVGSAALEAAVTREAQETLGFSEAFLAVAGVARKGEPYPSGTIEEAYLRASLYDEHTFGAAESIDRPWTINSKIQWAEKSMNAYRTRLLATRLESEALRSWAPAIVPAGQDAIVVFNSLCWKRSGPVVVRLSRGIVDDGTSFRLVDAATGKEVPYQMGNKARNYREVEFVAREVPSVGYRTYRIEAGDPAATGDDPFVVEGARISNGLSSVELDADRAGIRSIVAPGSRGNIVGDAEHAFNQYVYERIVHKKGRWWLWPEPAKYDPAAFRVETPSDAKVEPGARGPVRKSLRMSAKLAIPEGDVRLETEVSLYRGLPGVYIANKVHKPEVLAADASYFAYPFAAESRPRADLVGGVMVPGLDQIPRSALDWHMIQRWVRCGDGRRDAVWVTVDAPLVQFGGLNTGKYGRGLHLERPLVYSWTMNNYWFTNFLATQRGDFLFRYAVAGGAAAVSDASANRFGREVCSPLRGAAVEGRSRKGRPARSFLRVEPAELCLVAIKKAERVPRGLVVRIRNYRGETCQAVLQPLLDDSPSRAWRTSIIEEPRGELPLSNGAVTFELGPWALETVVFRWD